MSSVARVKLRSDTAATWTAVNPTLALGEVGIETDTRAFKVGTGAIAWNALPYFLSGVHIRGQISRTADGTVNIATAGTYVSTGLTATLDTATAFGIGLGTTDLFAVKNTSGTTQILDVYASIDAHAGNNQILGIRLAKNGVSIPETECRATSNTTEVPLSTTWLISAAPNDEISIRLTNYTNTTSLSVKRGRLVARGVSQ
jgi:hypothetical protein